MGIYGSARNSQIPGTILYEETGFFFLRLFGIFSSLSQAI